MYVDHAGIDDNIIVSVEWREGFGGVKWMAS